MNLLRGLQCRRRCKAQKEREVHKRADVGISAARDVPMQKKDVKAMPCHHQYVSHNAARTVGACQRGDVKGTSPQRRVATRGSIAAPKAKKAAQKKTSRRT